MTPTLLPRGRVLLLLALLAPAGVRADGPAKARKLDFNRDVRPIVSDNCFACHGPDRKKRKAKLRLDAFDATLTKGGILVPGKAGQSELVKRLEIKTPGKQMPPKKSGKKLTAAQIATLKQWVNEGASYSQHWAYVPPKRPVLPVVKNTA